MDRHNSKRPRESSSSLSSSSSSSSSGGVRYEQSSRPEIEKGEKRQHVDGREASSSPDPGRLLFDNLDPWLNDGLIYSKSEDWKFEDVFFTSFDEASSTTADTALTVGTAFTELSGQLVWCNLPDPWEEEYEAHAAPLDGGGSAAGEGMDCIWSSLLNQPLQQGSSAL